MSPWLWSPVSLSPHGRKPAPTLSSRHSPLAEFPDKYVRRDEVPAQETGITSRGFNGDNLVQIPLAAAPPPGARPAAPLGAPVATPPNAPGAPAAPNANAPVIGLKQDFARLLLGMFASSLAAHPMTFSHAGIAEAPEGKADVVQVNGPAGFSARLFIDSQTHLPVMLSWQAPPMVRPMPGQPPPGPTENRLYYADYRTVDGLKLPHRIRRATGASTNEEMTFDRYRVNASIDPRKFDPRKEVRK